MLARIALILNRRRKHDQVETKRIILLSIRPMKNKTIQIRFSQLRCDKVTYQRMKDCYTERASQALEVVGDKG